MARVLATNALRDLVCALIPSITTPLLSLATVTRPATFILPIKEALQLILNTFGGGGDQCIFLGEALEEDSLVGEVASINSGKLSIVFPRS